MSEHLSRRGFLGATGAAAVGSANGLRGVTRAVELMSHGTDTLGALVGEGARPDTEPMVARPTGTINLNAVNAAGEVSSVTTTSGLAWKIPGRAGALHDTAHLFEKPN